MHSYYIPHKLSVGDITRLSDYDSRFIIQNRLHEIESIIQIETLDSIFRAVITDISTNSIEVEILEKISDRKRIDTTASITVIQAISSEKKFSLFVEKAVEIGVNRIIPIESEYCTVNLSQANRSMNQYQRVVKDATEQSRNPFPPTIDKPMLLKDILKMDLSYGHTLCLATENVKSERLNNVLSKGKSYIIAIGPETGWSSKDLDIFRKAGFEFVTLNGNILRTETAGLVISSIIRYLNEKI